MRESLKEWALYYASMGLAVFPLRPKDKRPATVNGCKAATTNKEQIADWWDKHPDSNIGIATGRLSGGLVVIDLDIDENKGVNGYDSLKAWQRENGELQETWQSITGRGGYHLLYMSASTHKNRVGLYEGIDIRGDGGYIVAPPSIHPNGRKYEWEQGPDEIAIAQADRRVADLLNGTVSKKQEKQDFPPMEKIPEGCRTDAMVRLVGRLKGDGLADESIRAAVRSENEKLCVPPLTERELEKTVFPALSRGWQAERPYAAVTDNGKTRPVKKQNLEMVTMDSVEEKAPDWLIMDYVPRYQITSLAGDGGSGKTTVWCALAAAISSEKMPFLVDGFGIPFKDDPQKVMFFSAEDSYEYTLKRRLRKNGAKMENIMSIDIADERFQDVKFSSPFLEQLLEKHRPVLCIFDPIQAFVPPDIRMGDRNAMRSCLAPLIGYGEKYGTTFLIIEHANK